MVDFKELRKILNGSNMSVKYYQNGKTAVTDSTTFKGMPMSSLEEAQDLVESALKEDTLRLARKCGVDRLDTLKTITDKANQNIGIVMDCMLSKKPMTAEEIRQKTQTPIGIRDSIVNGRWNIGNITDPTKSSASFPNIYLSPWEANSVYSQKGIFELIINKKAKSILLNGFYLENSHLSQRQLDIVKEKISAIDFKEITSNASLVSLVYGGSLVFPFFKNDTPITTGLPLSSLLKLGVLKKDCIDYFITLDRWNTFIIPPHNPTQKDFLRPEVYTIPFLGSDVHHSRCARIVTARQAGYWGQVINQGWGLSDLCGYLQSGMNYKVAIQSLPLMIQQMSILARVVNVDGVLATEGANALDALVEEETIKTREASIDNPVTMDVLGDIKSIDRNFGQVPELIRLLRQDLASDAALPEPLLFSSEKGNFSSGDDTQGNLFKQNESVQMIHKELEHQFKQLAKILIIDALGTDDDVIKALPYVQVHFDQPVIANALERAQIGKFQSETVFNLISARLPIDIAVEMADKNVSSDMRTNSDIIEKLRTIQARVDEQDEKRVELDFKQKEYMIKQAKAEEEEITKGTSPADKEEQGYTRLEQKQHSKVRLGSTKRHEKLAKTQNKSV